MQRLRKFPIVVMIALAMALLSGPILAQDSDADTAKALLDKGVGQYNTLGFADAKATLLQVNRSKLPAGQAKQLDDLLAKVDPAIARQNAGMEDYRKARAALDQGKLDEAYTGFLQVTTNLFTPKQVREDAWTLAAQAEDKMKKATAAAPPATVVTPVTPAATSTPAAVPTAAPVAAEPAAAALPAAAPAPMTPAASPAVSPGAPTAAPVMPASMPAAEALPSLPEPAQPTAPPAELPAAPPPTVPPPPAPPVVPSEAPIVTSVPSAPPAQPEGMAAQPVAPPPAAVEGAPAPGTLADQASEILRRKEAQDWLRRGNMAIEVNNLDDAQHSYEKALELLPGMPEAKAGLDKVQQLRIQGRRAIP